MDKINNLGLRQRIERYWIDIARNRITRNSEGVQWVSYHVPKTAGTSFRKALNSAFSKKRVYGVYQHSGANELSLAQPIWVPAQTKVVHGHFRPHKQHQKLFPNAKRIIWLRDPVKRTWSLLNHSLDIQNNRVIYNYLKTNFLDNGITAREELFHAILMDEQSKKYFNMYSRVLQDINRQFFDFIGSSDDYEKDLSKLSNIMDTNLTLNRLNKSKTKQPVPEIPSKLTAYFDQEYKIYNHMLAR